jgi:transcriptional/translational regulatory protein YebC/TACO1
VREAFARFGGHLAAQGAVAYLFNEVGALLFGGADPAALSAVAFEAGAEDVTVRDDGTVEVLTAPQEFTQVSSALRTRGFASRWERPRDLHVAKGVTLEGEAAAAALGLLFALERIDGVRNVYTNAEISDAVLASLPA